MIAGKKRIIVLGASGQVGSFVLEGLKQADEFEVLGTSRRGEKNLIKFDPFLNDWSEIGKADVLINCIGIIKESKEFTFEKIHIAVTELIIKNKSMLGSPKVIQISALGANPEHKVTFLRTKAIADNLLLKSGNAIILRPSIICTPGTMLVKKFDMLLKILKLTHGFLPVPAGFTESRVQPVMPGDIVNIIYSIIQKDLKNLFVNITGSEIYSYKELIYMLAEVNKIQVNILKIPRVFTDIPVRFIVSPLLSELINYQQYQLLFTDNIADNKPAEDITGVSPSSTREFWIKEFSRL